MTMKAFRDLIGNVTYPVVEYRRTPIYDSVTGTKTSNLESCYSILYGYDKIDIKVADDGRAITAEQIQSAADAGTPIQVLFNDLEVTVRPKTQWEIKVSGRASKAVVANASK